MKKLVPKGFYPIALSEINRTTAIAYFNKERRLLYFAIGDKTIGPIPPNHLETLMHVMTDVKDMRGRFHPINIPEALAEEN